MTPGPAYPPPAPAPQQYYYCAFRVRHRAGPLCGSGPANLRAAGRSAASPPPAPSTGSSLRVSSSCGNPRRPPTGVREIGTKKPRLQLFQFFPAKTAFDGPGPQNLKIGFLPGEEQRELAAALDFAHEDRADRPPLGVHKGVIILEKRSESIIPSLKFELHCASLPDLAAGSPAAQNQASQFVPECTTVS